jgi:hypothetical protein
MVLTIGCGFESHTAYPQAAGLATAADLAFCVTAYSLGCMSPEA